MTDPKGAHSFGARIKRARQERRLTLKMVEAASGVSAAHVSEIERGETTPTVGVLAQIARALGRRAAYFLEDVELADVSLVSPQDRVRESRASGGAHVERLTASIPGGRLQAVRVVLSPGRSHRSARHEHEGVEAVLVLSGRVRVDAGGQSMELAEGEVAHYDANLAHSYANASRDAEAVLLWFATRRDVE